MAKTKQSGKTTQHKQRPGKRLGIKVFGGQTVKSGSIIVRQKGSLYHAQKGVKMGRDHTLYATREGIVEFKQKRGKRIVEVN